MPVEGGKAGEFAWRDGALLRALRNGDWVLLDEMNLASQSVLEGMFLVGCFWLVSLFFNAHSLLGLNSCLDHRSSVYIPELNRTFDCPSSFRVFACQVNQ